MVSEPHDIHRSGGRDMIPAAYVAAFDIAVQPKANRLRLRPLKLFDLHGARPGDCSTRPTKAMREVLSDGINALLFSPADLGSLKQALQRLVPDLALRMRLGVQQRHGHRTAERELTWDGNAARITAAFAAGVGALR